MVLEWVGDIVSHLTSFLEEDQREKSWMIADLPRWLALKAAAAVVSKAAVQKVSGLSKDLSHL